MNATFEMNGQTYRTDADTVNVLREIIPEAVRIGDYSAVFAVMDLGLKYGRIVKAEES